MGKEGEDRCKHFDASIARCSLSLKEFSSPESSLAVKKEFVRYSQRYQSNSDKMDKTQALLEKKRQKLKQLKELQDQTGDHSMRDVWHSFQDSKDNQDVLHGENGMRIGYRPTIKHIRRYPRILYFLHIHKSAGSTFCRQAYLNRISANYNQNCNGQADQHCCGNNDTLQAQREFANTTHYDLVAAEQKSSVLQSLESFARECRKLRQRELERLSRHNHSYPLTESAVAWIQETIRSGRNSNDHVQAAKKIQFIDYTIRDYNGTVNPVGNYTKWLYGQPDNYNVRMICGVRCTHVPKFQISRDLFRYTLQRLANFAHIIFVEDMEASFAKFARAYGWQYNVGTSAHHHGQRLNATALTSVLQTRDAWDPYMSALDDALYEFGQQKYQGASNGELSKLTETMEFTNSALLEEYFEPGPSRDCPNECCGVCSKW